MNRLKASKRVLLSPLRFLSPRPFSHFEVRFTVASRSGDAGAEYRRSLSPPFPG